MKLIKTIIVICLLVVLVPCALLILEIDSKMFLRK